ncbi:MAG: patatin-like phospholipase family protein [Anaerolineales bacterium]|nr:patatin-like phospholipase family protein [Anaerolineales bacterium]MCA9931266.1 patatin-like phospholipase family protein [Anaerolineales bacterium]
MNYLENRPKVGLALSGGVARGPVHVGVLTVLEREGIPIDCVAGASAGSLVGSAYCAGLEIPEMRELALQTGWHNVAALAWPRQGFVSFAKMEPFLENRLGKLDIRDLSIPFAAVATDMRRGEQVILREGRLATAVRASCSVPGFITPVELDGMLLCDGGVSDNLPVDALREMGADYVIGVDLFVPNQPKWGPFGMGAIAIETLVRQSGGGYKAADCLILPDLAGKSYLRFSYAEEYIAIGEDAAKAAVPVIKEALAL